MADVQQEKGHIRIANNLYRAVTLAKVTPIQRCAILECLWRQYGWAKRGKRVQPFPLGGTDLGKSIGCSRPTASTAISGLVEMRVLLKTTSGRFLLEKDFDRWRCGFNGDPDRVHWTAAHGYLDPSEVLENDDAGRNEILTPALAAAYSGRNETLTRTTLKSQSVAGPTGALEPRRAKESQGEPRARESQVSLIPKPKKNTKTDPRFVRIWNGVKGYVSDSKREYPPADLVKLLVALFKADPDLSVDTLAAMPRWIMESPQKYPQDRRADGYCKTGTLYKQESISNRMGWCEEWLARGAPKAKPVPGSVTGLTPDQWWNSSAGGKRACSEALALFDANRLKVAEMLDYISKRDGSPSKAWLEPKVEAWKDQVREQRKASR